MINYVARLFTYLQVGQASQSQQVHCAHSHAAPLQQPQHDAAGAGVEVAFTLAVNGAATRAAIAEAMSRNGFIGLMSSFY
ncbi:MAG: hypothetical protein JO295_08220 [Verrucomicrobia bacterium]|nr:hypothetical protein [Verrucomicrobiota bacterium]